MGGDVIQTKVRIWVRHRSERNARLGSRRAWGDLSRSVRPCSRLRASRRSRARDGGPVNGHSPRSSAGFLVGQDADPDRAGRNHRIGILCHGRQDADPDRAGRNHRIGILCHGRQDAVPDRPNPNHRIGILCHVGQDSNPGILLGKGMPHSVADRFLAHAEEKRQSAGSETRPAVTGFSSM